jgi:hypothetical protein
MMCSQSLESLGAGHLVNQVAVERGQDQERYPTRNKREPINVDKSQSIFLDFSERPI